MSKCPKDWGRKMMSSRLAIGEKMLWLFKRKPEHKNPCSESGQHPEGIYISSKGGDNEKLNLW